MKKRIGMILSAIALAIVMCFAVGCDKTPDDGGGDDTPDPIVVSISVTHAPDKTEYMAGEEFDRTGMVITARYNNNTQAVVTDYTVDKTVLREEDTFVIITYKQKKTTQAVTVLPNDNPDDLIDIVIPDIGTYKVEAEDLLGDGSGYLLDTNSPAAPWTSGSSAIGYMKTNDASGNSELKVRFTLEKDLLVSIAPVMAFYTSFEWNGLSVKIDDIPIIPVGTLGHAAACPGDGDQAYHWQNWREVDFGIHSLEAGKHVLSIELLEGAGPGLDYISFTTFDKDATEGVRMIYVDTTPNKLAYEDGEVFDAAGLVIKAKHVSGEDTVIDNADLDIVTEQETLSTNDKFVTFGYGGKTVREPITVTLPAPPPVIELPSEPDVTLDGDIVRLEAETLQCVDGKSIKLANQDTWLDYMPVNKPVTIYVDVKKAGRYSIKISGGRYEGYSFEHMTIAIDGGTPVTLDYVESIPTTGEFFNAVVRELGTFELTEGMHAIEFVNSYRTDNGLTGMGVDYFEFSDADKTVFSVTYELNGGEGEAPVEDDKTVGDTVAAAAAPTRDGYEFKGWSDGTNIYQAGETFEMPANNVTLTAQWEKNYDVTLNGGTTKFEAEELDCVGALNIVLFAPTDATAEGREKWSGDWVDYMRPNVPLTVKIMVEKAGTYTVQISAGRWAGYSLAADMTLTVDGENIDLSAVPDIPDTGHWHEPGIVELGSFEFSEGLHTIVLVNSRGDNGCGIDYFEFVEVE